MSYKHAFIKSMTSLTLQIADYQSLMDLETRLKVRLQNLFACRTRLKYQLWHLAIGNFDLRIGSDLQQKGSISPEKLRQWLSEDEVESCFLSPGQGGTHTEEEQASKDWLFSALEKFYESKKQILQISGPAGCGKSGIIGRLLKLVGFDAQQDTKILCFSASKENLPIIT